MKLEMTETGFFAFKGNKFIYIGTEHESNSPVNLCKVLTQEELKRIDDNPSIFRSQEDLYHLLTS